MKFTVLQFDLKKYVVDGNFTCDKMQKVHFDITFHGKVDPIVFIRDYREVCEIEASDLDEVFKIGNIGPEEKITRLLPMHSISVGDVIMDEKYRCFVVSGSGFTRLEKAATREVIPGTLDALDKLGIRS